MKGVWAVHSSQGLPVMGKQGQGTVDNIKGQIETSAILWNGRHRNKTCPSQRHLNFLDLGIIVEGQGRETS